MHTNEKPPNIERQLVIYSLFLYRFRKILDEQEFPILLPDSPQKIGTIVEQTGRTPSPILSGNTKDHILRKRLNLTTSISDDLETSEQVKISGKIDKNSSPSYLAKETDDSLEFIEPGSNKWECIPHEELDNYLAKPSESCATTKLGNQADVVSSDIARPVAKSGPSPLEELKKKRSLVKLK
ncbi:Exodeoxyribonuclease 7 large subunit [Frankliniella fusca]|uniref:Exodeoxyribonuclease 7 large subunit n=1 Tax=Frankliniella fusca TaxID=407009 RepID=A0AAE1H3R1_9NEOP|nr:Exodeoxyribonuclease 7 large subunit [Frankliniella fusca]